MILGIAIRCMKPLKDYVWFREKMERSGMKGRDGAMNITERERTEKRRHKRRSGACMAPLPGA